jgi:undecaprenyl-diphosphatase
MNSKRFLLLFLPLLFFAFALIALWQNAGLRHKSECCKSYSNFLFFGNRRPAGESNKVLGISQIRRDENRVDFRLLFSGANNWITFLASFLIWFMYLGLFLWFYLGKIPKRNLFFVLVSSLMAWVLSQMFKDLLPTVRPFLLNGVNPLTLTTPVDNSFPSGHTASAFGLATAIFLIDKKLGIFYFFLASLVGVGRILSRVHFPVDVLGGATLGIFAALLLEALFFKGKALKRK